MSAVLKITDGTTTVNLLGAGNFYLAEWRPSIAPYKGGGTFTDSPFAHGRRLVNRRFDNPVETFILRARSRVSADDLILNTQTMLALLEQGASYWESGWQGYPVWIEAKSSKETNTRYAIIHSAHVVDLGNPYSQPFLVRGCGAAWDELSLVVERGHWQSSPPATKPCVSLAIIPWAAAGEEQESYLDVLKKTAPYAVYKLNEASGTKIVNYIPKPSPYDGNGTYIGSPSYENLTFLTGEKTVFIPTGGNTVADLTFPSINDYFSGAQGAISFWFNTTGPMWTGTGGDFYWFNIEIDSTHYLRMYKVDNGGSAPYITEVAFNSHSAAAEPADVVIPFNWGSALDPISNKWHNVIVTWYDDQSTGTTRGGRFIRLYVNGQLAGVASANDPDLESWPAFDSESGSVVYVGGRDVSTAYGSISSTVAYVALWRRLLTSQEAELITDILATSYDTLEITDDNLDTCEELPVGSRLGLRSPIEPPMLSRVFTNNSFTNTGLDVGWIFDTSLANYTDLFDRTIPYDLLPSNAGVGDILYLGISTAAQPNAKFTNVIFDIDGGTNNPGGYTLIWEYWDGSAWSTISSDIMLNDETNGLLNAGVKGVFFDVMSDWATTSVNGVAAYWIRGRVTAVSGNYNPPQQINRDVYTCNWPYVRVPAFSFDGEIPASVGLKIVNRSFNGTDDPTSGADHPLTAALIGGARTVSRGPFFNAYLNLGNQHNPPFTAVSLINADAAFSSTTPFPAIQTLKWSPTIQHGTGGVRIACVEITGGMASHYSGIFRVLMRLAHDAPDGGNPKFKLTFHRSQLTSTLTPPSFHETDLVGNESTATISSALSWVTLDLGTVDLSSGLATPDDYARNLYIGVWGAFLTEAPPASWDAHLGDIILIPADEWWFEAGDITGALQSYLGQDNITQGYRELEINGFTHPKVPTTFNIHDHGFAHVARWRGITNSRPYLLPGVEQKIWFAGMNLTSVSASGVYALGEGYQWTHLRPGLAHSHRLIGVNNYLSLRGAN